MIDIAGSVAKSKPPCKDDIAEERFLPAKSGHADCREEESMLVNAHSCILFSRSFS